MGIDGGKLRKPLLPLTEKESTELSAILKLVNDLN